MIAPCLRLVFLGITLYHVLISTSYFTWHAVRSLAHTHTSWGSMFKHDCNRPLTWSMSIMLKRQKCWQWLGVKSNDNIIASKLLRSSEVWYKALFLVLFGISNILGHQVAPRESLERSVEMEDGDWGGEGRCRQLRWRNETLVSSTSVFQVIIIKISSIMYTSLKTCLRVHKYSHDLLKKG